MCLWLPCRTYILDAIDSSVDMINDGIIMLQEARPNPKIFPKLQRLKVRLLGPGAECVTSLSKQPAL